MGMGRRGVGFQEEEREWRLPDPLYADYLVLCGESEEKLRTMVGHFVEVCRRRGLKVYVSKSKVMELGGKKRLECEVCMDGVRLEHVSESKYLGCVLDESGTYEAERRRKVVSRRMVAVPIRYLVNGRGLKLECTRSLHESLLVPVLMYGSETMLWKKKEMTRIRAVQMNNL